MDSTSSDPRKAGAPYPLGATLTAHGTNFAIYSEHATLVELCLFDELGQVSRRCQLTAESGHDWHTYVAGIQAGQRYGYRVNGPWSPDEGHLFNPAKLLIDPYAAAIEGPVVWRDPIFGYLRGEHPDPHVASLEDSSHLVPRSVVVDHRFDWEGDLSPAIPMSQTVIYETHVKGISQRHPDVPPELRGTYLGLAHPAILDHLKRLGVTTIELLPTKAFVDEQFLGEVGLSNYWGYNSIGFFAPEQRYARSNCGNEQVREFKTMVRELHRHGLEVLLDVVFNHTAEGDRWGPTLSFRGVDNRTYYRLSPSHPTEYVNYTGTGNTINIDHPAVLRMVLDSLRTWVTQYHVDGFRFDLAPALGRDGHSFSNRAAFFKAVFQDPVLSRVKLIAEPWDVGPHGYQVGHFPVGWSEWNDRFRDAMRSFWLAHPVTTGEFALRMSGSADLYEEHNRGPLASINYVTCHDGFTLTDLVSYDHKHNQANKELNRDGHGHNLSRNFGAEGPTDEPAINASRARARRNLLACTVFADGVPMLLGGDELGRTQQGNNNAYPQDNEITWYDWSPENRDDAFLAFVARALRCRAAFPQLRRSHFRLRELPGGYGVTTPAWHEPDGSDVQLHEWGRESPRTLQLRLSGNGSGFGEVLLLFNADERDVAFTLPAIDHPWRPVLDTSSPDGVPASDRLTGNPVTVPGETLVLLADRDPFSA